MGLIGPRNIKSRKKKPEINLASYFLPVKRVAIVLTFALFDTLSVRIRCDSLCLLKCPSEVIGVGKATLASNLLNGTLSRV